MFSISLIVVATGALIAPTAAIAAPTASIADATSHAVDDTVMTQLTSAAEQLLGSRAGELVADQKPMTVDTRMAAVGVTAQAAQRESNVRARVRANRAWLTKRSEAYTGSRTTLEMAKATRRGTSISLRATEVTYLDYAKIHGDEPPNTAYTADHEFVYEGNGAGGWTLLEDRQLEPTGLLPLREAVTYVYGKTSMPTNTLPRLVKGEVPASTTRKADPTAKVSTTGLRAGYSYSAMATYLERYWSNYNAAYRSYAGAGNGGDCTNFASQALKAGGWGQITGFYMDSSYWWYNSGNQTYSWTSVNHLSSFGFERGRFTSLSNVWSLGLGDVLQIDGARDGSKDHTMMVSYKTSSSPYFTYHSSNRYRRSMQTVLNDWGAANYYADRT